MCACTLQVIHRSRKPLENDWSGMSIGRTNMKTEMIMGDTRAVAFTEIGGRHREEQNIEKLFYHHRKQELILYGESSKVAPSRWRG